jgi:hypothetical protein
MRLSLKSLAITCALLWGGCLFFVAVGNLAFPPYGAHFLQGVSSIYPGFHASGTIADVLVGTGYAIVDGGIGGFVFGALYNAFVRP